jgi:RNA 3'-terminal phosphate cyclase (ATP)
MLEIDGSQGEGGGQILRTSLTLSLITGRAVRLTRIRGRRPKPGLQPQHLVSVRSAATIGQARVVGDAPGSAELTFEPGEVQAGRWRFSIGTAGATGLVLQTLYLPLALRGAGPSEITLEGGTHVKTSPCFHFLDVTWRAYLQVLGLDLTLTMERAGFFPRGGGLVHMVVQPCRGLAGLRLVDREPVRQASGFSAIAGLPENVARRQARRATARLRERGLDSHVPSEEWFGGPGSVLAVTLPTTPAPSLFFGLGAKGKPAEAVADEAVDQVMTFLNSGAPVDWHSADQLLLPLALAGEPSEFHTSAVTPHLSTNAAIIRQFLEREISIEGEPGQPAMVRIGAGKV